MLDDGLINQDDYDAKKKGTSQSLIFTIVAKVVFCKIFKDRFID